MKIKEVIVVEGKNDAEKLKSFFDCDTIITHGLQLNEKTLEMIKSIQEKRGIIIFTDPDSPGEKIRRQINQYVDGCKNAFIDKSKAKTIKKVGVEHASRQDLEESLKHVMTYTKELPQSLSWLEFLELGCSGKKDSAAKRRILENYLHIGQSNAKTLYKRLNMLQITKAECIEILKEQK